MIKMIRIPGKLQSFFSSLKGYFKWDHYKYFCSLVVLIVYIYGKRTVSNIVRSIGWKHPHRTRFNNFLHLLRWDYRKVLQQKALELIRRIGISANDKIYLIFDDTKKPKRGKKMELVDWIYEPKTKRKIRGIEVIQGVIFFKGYIIPWGLSLFISKEWAKKLGVALRKSTEIVAELIASFNPPAGVKVIVLFDSYYLCSETIKACKKKGFYFVSVIKRNRNVIVHAQKKKAMSFQRSFWRNHKKKTLLVRKSSGNILYSYVSAGWLDVSKVGRVQLILSRKWGGRIFALVSNHPHFSAKDVIFAYEQRWWIEVFFDEVKNLLGMGQYQNLSREAAACHLHLVCFAHALLTHLYLERTGAQGKQKRRLLLIRKYVNSQP